MEFLEYNHVFFKYVLLISKITAEDITTIGACASAVSPLVNVARHTRPVSLVRQSTLKSSTISFSINIGCRKVEHLRNSRLKPTCLPVANLWTFVQRF